MGKSIILLGSTGSVGLQAADVARAQSYDVRALCANNNFIKVIKRIAFGFRSFHRFKARIMICKNLLHIRKANA